MTPGIIPLTSIPGWPTPLAGIMQQLPVAAFLSPNGLNVADVTTAENYLSTYAGSTAQLSWNQQQHQAQLNALLEHKLDLVAFICAEANSSMDATNVATTLLATVADNYRSLRAQISAATSLGQLQAINIYQGWPRSPVMSSPMHPRSEGLDRYSLL
jgi:hypothetical protein